jgi:primosomal protein N' (replication factor Y) (superfamily II helicase)
MPERVDLFADVILPLALPNFFTYRVPQAMQDELQPGMRVVVQFGKSKLYAALVRKIHTTAPRYTAKYIDTILDTEPVVGENQLAFWDWMSDYYLCHIGEVMIAALPTGLRLTSETRVILNPSYVGDRSELNDDCFLLCDALDVRQNISLEEAGDILDRKAVYPVIRKLIDAGVVLTFEEMQERYKPRMETLLSLADVYRDEEKLRALFDKLEKKAFKQLAALMAFVQISGFATKEILPVRKSLLTEACKGDSSGINALIKKEILIAEEIEVSRLKSSAATAGDVILSPHQNDALLTIQKHFETLDTVLLHGVTSGGKTEVYIRLIHEFLKENKQTLFLLPEIALTTQLIGRLQKHFGEKVFVYHSRFNEHERVEVWKKVKQGGPQIIIGARSALFLPFHDLGLIIVDEEHDPSYKQHDPAPRYSARDSALVLAHRYKAKTVLGSATPSVETYHHAQAGRYGLALLTERYGGAVLPEMLIVDIKEEAKKKRMQSHFSSPLIEQMETVLKNGEQIILFQNRRGFAPALQCATCGHVPNCIRCDVSLTFHKHINQLRCHYCGWTTPPPSQCEACGSTDLLMRGFGTEKVEEELSLIFPSAKIARMDLDTTRGKNSMQQLISDFENRKIDILVGTQMVTKGLDFAHVALVGVLMADSLFSYPDFRAAERGYQLLAQVSGRAGRRGKQGLVVVQTAQPEHAVIRIVRENAFEQLYANEITERRLFRYPPFHRMIRFTIKCKDVDLLNYASRNFTEALRKHFGVRVLGPEAPPVGKVRDEFLMNVLFKIERESSIAQARKLIASELIVFRANPDFKKVRIVCDVDPV